MKEMVESDDHRHLSLRGLAMYAQRIGRVVASPSTWSRLARFVTLKYTKTALAWISGLVIRVLTKVRALQLKLNPVLKASLVSTRQV